MEKRLFAFDIDGTLVNDKKEVMPSTIKAIQKLIAKGHIVILSTGRLPCQTKDLVRELKLKHYIVGAAGALIYSISDKTTQILSSGIPRREKEELLRLARHYKRELSFNNGIVYCKVYFGNNVLEEVKDEQFFVGGSSRVPIYEDFEKVKKFYFSNEIIQASFKAETEITKDVYEHLKKFINHPVSVHETSRVYAELGIEGIHKYSAIELICKKEDVNPDNVYCFGDSDNDLEMLTHAKNSVAMGNAKESIKKIAKYTIGTNNEDAIYNFLLKQKLI